MPSAEESLAKTKLDETLRRRTEEQWPLRKAAFEQAERIVDPKEREAAIAAVHAMVLDYRDLSADEVQAAVAKVEQDQGRLAALVDWVLGAVGLK